MLSSQPHPNLSPGQLFDETSNSKLKVQNGHIVVEHLETGKTKLYPLPPLKFKDQKIPYVTLLKFVSKSPNINLNPAGNILTCKTLNLQQVEMNKTFSKEVAYWQLYVPQKTQLLNVGIKSKDKAIHMFTFCLNKPAVLTFRLDLEKKTFTCWLNGVRSEHHKPFKLQIDTAWTPFVQLKISGTSVILNSLATDPESSVVSYFNSGVSEKPPAFVEPQIRNDESSVGSNNGQYSLQKFSNDKILLVGQNTLKVLYRSENSKSFNFGFAQLNEDDKLTVFFTEKEFANLIEFSKRINVSLMNIKLHKNGDQVSAILDKKEWLTWVDQVLRFLNDLQKQTIKKIEENKTASVSLEHINLIAQIILSKTESINPLLNPSQRVQSLYSEFNRTYNNSTQLPFFEKLNTSFLISKSTTLNNIPFIKFSSQILAAKCISNSYIGCLMKEGNRISIINAESVAFKVIDTVLSRGFTKETEINQYKKEIDDIQDSDFTKPHIFKILKNCLKYADKIKPPEKLLQQIEKKKQAIENKKAQKEKKTQTKKPQVNVDKSLLNTLILMGFGQKPSTKALIDCKNQSLEAAIELILGKYKDEKDPIETVTKPKRDWQCQACTLINFKDATICNACDTPAPLEAAFEEVEILEEKKEEQAKKVEEPKEQDIISHTIENEKVRDFFLWNTQIAYCPILIAAVFDTKIRFRLLGPNPKFYSTFYVKDNGYFDLTTMKLHDFAHQIDQSPISHGFYLSSSAEEQKRANWGWMNIEDWDFGVEAKTVSSINFQSLRLTDKDHKFEISINGQNSAQRLNCRILIENVYEEKKRCFVVDENKITEGQKAFELNDNVLKRKGSCTDETGLILSSNSHIVSQFSLSKPINDLKLCQIQSSTTSHPTPKHQLIPLILTTNPFTLSQQPQYPTSIKMHSPTLQNINQSNQWRNALVFKHINDKTLNILQVKLTNDVKHKAEKAGYFYLTNDLTKVPLFKQEFGFTDQNGKQTFEFTGLKGKYFVIGLNPKNLDKENSQTQNDILLKSVGVYGQVLDIDSNNEDQANFLAQFVKVQFQESELNEKNLNEIAKVNVELLNYPIDLSSIEPSKARQHIIQSIKSGIPIDIQVKLSLKDKKISKAHIQSVTLDNWNHLNSYTEFTRNASQVLTEQEFQQYLQSFVSTTENEYFEIIKKQQHKEFRSLITKLDLTEFAQKLISCPVDKQQRKKLKEFIKLFGQHLKNNKSINALNLLESALASPKLTPYGSQLVFLLIKSIARVKLSNYLSLIESQLKAIAAKKESGRLQSTINLSGSLVDEKTIFSDLFYRLSKKQESQISNDLYIHYHYICLKTINTRKYIIDMMSLYYLNKVKLNFETFKYPTKMIIEFSYIDETGKQQPLGKHFYNQRVSAQLNASPSLEFNLNQVKSRYLILNFLFTAVPYAYSKKEESNVPSYQIVPIVSGSYIGEAEPFLHEKFDISPTQLQLIKKVDQFSKYSVIQAENLTYYNSEQVSESQKLDGASIQELQQKENSQANRQALIKLLMKNPSKQNVNFNLTLSYLLIDAALETGDNSEISELKFSQDMIGLFVEHFINLERHLLHDKAFNLLGKLTNCNTSAFNHVLYAKFLSPHNLPYFFKEIKLNEDPKLMAVIDSLISKQNFRAHQYLAGNLAVLLKSFNFEKQLVEKFIQAAYEAECYQQTVTVLQKYGWTFSTKDIVHKLYQLYDSNQGSKIDTKQSLLLIISSATNTTDVSSVAFEALKQGNLELFDWILTELSKPSRLTKIDDLEDILFYRLSQIQSSKDEVKKRQEYLDVLKAINTFGYTPKIVEEIIKVFFKLSQRNAYLHSLLESNFLKALNQQQSLFRIALNELNEPALGNHELTLLNDILVFILSKEPTFESEKISFSFDHETQELALHYFVKFIENMLNFGGLQTAKLIDLDMTERVKIAFYLSRFLQTEKVFASLKEQTLESLIRWLMLNITVSAKTTKTTNSSRFLKVENIVWDILEAKGKIQPQLFAQLYVKTYKAMREKASLCKNDVVRYDFNRKMDVFNIRVLEKFANEQQQLVSLLKENGLFAQILNQLTKLKTQTLRQAQLNSEIELANNLKVQPDSKETPKDWLLYKQGVKNHVYKIEYSKSTNQTYDLTLQSQISSITLSKIIIGFKHDLTAEKNVCLPKRIHVEAGMTLDSMRYLGEMFEVKDDRYMNFSVKLFGFNSSLINGLKDLNVQLNKNVPVQFLRFKIRSPEPVSIEDALATQSAEQKNSTSLISFLSVQGYTTLNAQPFTSQLVRYLELISQVQHKDLVNVLFKQQAVVEAFKSALLNISFLMKNQNYEKILHNFLMRICQQNTSIGNEMIEKYLQLQNSELCAKISCEIVLSSDSEISNRAKTYFTFISKALLESKNSIDDIAPFLSRFTQIAFYVMNRNKFDSSSNIGEISLKVESSMINVLLREIEASNKSQETLSIVSKFLKTLITLGDPFSTQGIQLKSVLQQIYQRKNKLYDEILGALIVDHKQTRSWFMENKYFEATFEQTFNLIKTSPEITKLNRNLEFLTIISFNTNIKQLINKYQYNLMLFEMLMSKNYQSVLSSPNNQSLRKNFVDLIARTSLGSQNETLIASLLKDSIPNIISQGNQKFVGEIFLPLLNSYEKISVCILPYSKSENKLITDISSTDLNVSSGDDKVKSTQSNFNEQKLRLPLTLGDESLKQKIAQQVKKSHQAGNFNLAMNHGNYTTGLTDTFKKKVMNSSLPLMVILHTKNSLKQNQPQTTILFCNRTTKTTDNKISWSKGSFIIYSDNTPQNKCIIIDQEPTKSKDFIFFDESQQNKNFSVYEEQEDQLRFIWNGISFAHISFSYNDSNYFCFNKISKTINDRSGCVLDSVEYWLLTPTNEVDSKSNQAVQTQSQVSSLTKSLLSSNYDRSLFNPQHLSNRSINNLRYERVYEFPTSITVSQLKQSLRIINCSLDDKKFSQLQLSLLGHKDIFTQEMTLEQIRRKSTSKDILLLDINMNFDNLLSLMNLKQQSKKQEVDFLPRKGILKYFEENDGIQAMIKVIKKSIQSWKNKARMEKWLQYVIELENFSHFPHFFAIYLKDKETFRLLFNLLAGLPDKETDTKWDELQSSSSQKLLKIVSQILLMDKTSQFRDYALKNNFFITILERLRILTGIFKRKYDKDYKDSDDEQDLSPSKNQVEDDGTKKIKKKKGVGYGNDQSSNTKWMKGEINESKKKEFEVVEIILNIIENFLDIKQWKIPDSLLENIYESALLPFIEDGLRAGTLLQISKHPEKFKVIFKIIKTFSKHERLVPVLMPISKNYQPRQIESIESLLKSLENIASIFLSCLNQNKTNQTKEEQISEQLANIIKETYVKVQEAIEDYKENHMNDQNQQKQLQEILQLPLDKKYRALMKDLRFDYIDMKQSPTKIKHHYSSNFNANYTPNQVKMIRLAQELADISTALPFEHTNAVYVRCDKDRVDFMQAMIMGANGTPYGHGAFLFDVYFDDNYPNNPPKVNLTTTGHGKVRFNPNLYACGKVCLSLLGTWRGSASENWDAKVSTLLQVLLSIQAIIMSEQVYFNEPGFENQQGTQEGEKKNEAYSNIVRYCNIKYAMIDNIRSPPKGFQTVVRRHFYLKKDEIMQECRKWQKYAQKRQANYIGLVNDHNHSWSNEFKKTKTTYKQMLDQAIKELEEELNKLQPPKITDVMTSKQAKKEKKKKVQGNKIEELEKQQQQEQIDVSYDKNKIDQAKEIDITDEKVKDRWSRYIGAMGIDAVSKQSKADILVFGLNPLGLETVKNLVLSGCRKLTICDDELVKAEDLAGGFFYTQEDIGKKRLDSILYKVKELNMYVKIDTIELKAVTPMVLKAYSLVLTTEIPLLEQIKFAQICREHKVKFISADSIGFICRIVNDLGEKFEVLDKNGEQPVEVFVKEITNDEKGIVTLLDGVKNPFEDGQAVLIRNIEGMKLKEDDTKSINDTIHKVKVINSKSFEIGNTLNYTPYVRNGTIKNIKTPVELSYKPFSEIVLDAKNVHVDENLAFYDFAKLENSKIVKCCYLTLEEFRKTNENKFPEAWSAKDMETFLGIFKTIFTENIDQKVEKFVRKFTLTCRGYLPPLCAFFGGMVCQEIIKAITQKFKPVVSEFYIEFSEIVPQLPTEITQASLETIFKRKESRDVGFESVIGNHLLEVIKDSKLFMIGSGAIGCELLKNFAMIGLGTGEKGKITLTDPDHIENSNLNRQFLFREKHISKSKSRTASEVVKLMNPSLKNKIVALTERVSDSTKDIFTNKFFEGLTLVANALDNVAARRYVDQRCVENKVPLFESGTLGPKGHVQVIIPYLTESYGSQNDPVEEGQIPHCTLKMFPEQTLHCVEWARDIFGKKFSLQPKGLLKVIDKAYKPEKDDIKSLNESLTMVKKGPKSFEDCINYAIHKFYKYFRDDVMQLLYTYPLDAKTKNGEPFWKLPKRPPTPIKQFDPENMLQLTFVSSLAVMIAKIYQIDYPKNFRSETERLHIGKLASKVKISDFVPSDEKAKEILKESTEKKQENAEEEQKEQIIQQKDENELHKEIITTGGYEFKIKPEEFEKDDDANGHIDFIYSMANLRAINYKLDPMEWINVKIKAGRIVPALATTTACVSGLQTLEICKYLKKVKIDSMKNSYLNLAVPSIQMSEPGEVIKKKITEKLTVNLWDRWDIECDKTATFGDLYEILSKKYELTPVGVLQGMSRIDTGKGEEAKKAFMKEKILDKLDMDENYIDLIVLFTKNAEEDKIIQGVPPVRLLFK